MLKILRIIYRCFGSNEKIDSIEKHKNNMKVQ